MMKIIKSIRWIASKLLFLGLIAVVLTLIQPMDPRVDKWFQIGGGLVFIVCLLILLLLKPNEEKIIKQDSSEKSEDLK